MSAFAGPLQALDLREAGSRQSLGELADGPVIGGHDFVIEGSDLVTVDDSPSTAGPIRLSDVLRRRHARPAGLRLGVDADPRQLPARPPRLALARRSISTGEIAFYRVFGRRGTRLGRNPSRPSGVDHPDTHRDEEAACPRHGATS